MIHPIRSRRSFDQLQRHGVRVRVDPLWCSHILDPQIRPPQVAFAVGRAYGTAVRRNRLRRRLRAALREQPPPPGLYLFGASPAAQHLTSSELRDRLERLIARLGPSTPTTTMTAESSRRVR